MDIGVGLDPTLGLSFDEQGEMAAEAARLGYTSVWTPEQNGADSFLACAVRWQATRDIVPGGLTTGISVSPVALRTPMGFAMSAGTMSKLTDGRFILGIGTGGAYMSAYRAQWGMRGTSTLALMRDYATVIRGLVAGETVTYEGQSVSLSGAQLTIQPPPRTPVYLGALGPEMCRLGGEVADGISLNWCTAEQVAWSRERLNEGAARAGRNPADLKIAEYIRICVDEDEQAARRAYAKNMMGYALGRPGAKPVSYRAHFERMGFATELRKIDEMRAAGADPNDMADAFPDALLLQVGYYGRAAGAAKAFKKLAEGLDISMVRVVAARPGKDSVRAVMEACKPAAVQAV